MSRAAKSDAVSDIVGVLINANYLTRVVSNPAEHETIWLCLYSAWLFDQPVNGRTANAKLACNLSGISAIEYA